MTQTCHLVPDRENVTDVLLFVVRNRSDLKSGHFESPYGLGDARRGTLPGYHLLAECKLPGMLQHPRIAEFRRVQSLPLTFVRQQAARADQWPRLLPLYRQHLLQAFARHFMRVGLPQDIPPSADDPELDKSLMSRQ